MRKVDLRLPQIDSEVIGGPASFLRNLHNTFASDGIRFNDSSKNIFFPISHDTNTLESLKSRGGKIIQRLDGIYYPQKHGSEYLQLNSDIKKIYQDLSTHVIFQSDYSRGQCIELFGDFSPSYKIYNGANKEIFRPIRKAGKPGKTIFASTGNFRNIDMIEPLVLAFDQLTKHFDVQLNLMGPFPNNSLKKYLERSYIKYAGASPNQFAISQFLNEADCFLYSHLNPPCPNSVIEAISCGLPVIGFESGSLGELCFFSRDLLVEIDCDATFQTYEMFDSFKLFEKIAFYLENKAKYDELALANSHLYDMKETASKYLDLFLDICGEKNTSLFSKIFREGK